MPLNPNVFKEYDLRGIADRDFQAEGYGWQ